MAKYKALTRSAVKGLTALFCRLSTAQYEMTGASRRYGTSCSYDFFSNRITKTGIFFSPLYPRNYPPFSRCQYAFHALPGEVVHLHFKRIRLDRKSQHKCALLLLAVVLKMSERGSEDLYVQILHNTISVVY